MYITAHRGFGGRYPENTVGAVEEAVRADGVDAVEIDVRRCGSGELVVIHHDHVAAISDSEGEVGDLSAIELAALDVEGPGEGVPRLEAVLDVVPSDVGLDVELKETRIAGDVLDMVGEVENDVVISALDANADALWETRVADESAVLACNFDVRPAENLETAELIGCAYANPHWALCLATDIIDRAHEMDLEVHAWPVTSRVVAEALRRRGVDGIVADTPDGARPIGEAIALEGLLGRLYRSG